MESLMQKLAVSKKIMDKHNEIPRTGSGGAPRVNTNTLPMEEGVPMMSQQPTQEMSRVAMSENKEITKSKIMSSNLPDEIKKLMIENPIERPVMNTSISDDVIEGATRLMGNNRPTQQINVLESTGLDTNGLKQMIRDIVRDTVRDVVKEELSSFKEIVTENKKTNENLKLTVGKHVFEGRVTSMKKLK